MSKRDEFDAKIKIPNISNVPFDYETVEDPQGVIPAGWICHNQYKVVIFLPSSSTHILEMMVGVKYPNCTGRYSTALNYISVLRDYMERSSLGDILESLRAHSSKKLEAFYLEHPELRPKD